MADQSVEANRLIKEFERRAKEAEAKEKGQLPNKAARLIEKFEKKATGVDEKANGGGGAMITNLKKAFEPAGAGGDELDKPAAVILAGSTNKLIERFQDQPPATE